MAKESINGVKIVCSECGSDDIMEKSWFNPNTGESFGWDESDECYCKRCGKLTQWKEVRPTINKKRTAYLVSIGIISRIVIDTTDKTPEIAQEEAMEAALQKIKANANEYIIYDNIEEVFEDTECPARNDEPTTDELLKGGFGNVTESDLKILSDLKSKLANEEC